MKPENLLICPHVWNCKRSASLICHHDHPHVRQADCRCPCLIHGTDKVSVCCAILGIVTVLHEERLDE